MEQSGFVDDKVDLPELVPWPVRMSIDVKIRVGLFLVSVAVTAIAAVASAHGLYVGFLDEIGGGGPI